MTPPSNSHHRDGTDVLVGDPDQLLDVRPVAAGDRDLQIDREPETARRIGPGRHESALGLGRRNRRLDGALDLVLDGPGGAEDGRDAEEVEGAEDFDARAYQDVRTCGPQL